LGDFKKRKINHSFDLEPQEILLDKLAQKQAEDLGISERKFEVPLSKNVLRFIYLIFLVLISLLFYRTFQLQVIEGKQLSVLSENNKFIIYQIKASRGVIYDKRMEQLVFNKASFDLVCNKNNLPKEESERVKVLREITEILGRIENFKAISQKIEESPQIEILISENLSHQELIILETRIKEFPGFQIENNIIRDYKEGEIFAHLIGYTGKIRTSELKENPDFYSIFDYVGRDGLEKSYEETLRKNPGKLQVERDALGNPISEQVIQFPTPGKNLVLWLDSDLQKKIKETLENKRKEIGAKGAVAIALDPNTGGVLALVSLPSFNNNLFQKGADSEALKNLLEDPFELEPLFNRAITGGYLVGSTIKPLIASAALQEQIISPLKKINCQGKIIVEDFWDPEKIWEYEDWKTHGWTDMRKAIAESCNVYFYHTGGGHGDQDGLGPTKIKEYLELFGWGDITGIDLPGEAAGFIPDKAWKEEVLGEGWWDGDTYYLSIGQQYLRITPLEVVTSFLSIANGGKLYQPQIVQKIVDNEKNIIKDFKPKVIQEDFIDSKNLQIVREGMREAVTYGSAVNWLNALPVEVAAKTGTAELGKNLYHNWVTVFAPYKNPQIVLTVMIENIKGEQVAALPVAKEILEWYFQNE